MRPGGPTSLSCTGLSSSTSVFVRIQFIPIGRTHLAVFTIVNALGAIVNRSGKVVLGNRDDSGKRVSVREALDLPVSPDPPAGNTTLTVVVTNQRLDRNAQRQLGRQVHASMARAIQPFHGRNDGDVLYAVTTNEVETASPTDFKLAGIASELAWDAVLSVVKPT
jgi:L-aminopeptidase/D-esterase-like protein